MIVTTQSRFALVLPPQPVVPITLLAMVGFVMVWGLAFPPPDRPMSDLVLAAPSVRHVLGTNQMGQDVLARTLAATPGTIGQGLAIGVLSTLIALLYGFLAVTAPAWIERLMMRCVDILIALPTVVLAMLLASYLRPTTLTLLFLLVVFAWPSEVRILGALIRREMQRDSYQMARSFGADRLYLIRRHLGPRMTPVLAALIVQETRRGVMHAAGLAFLGLTNVSSPTWGSLLAEATPLLYDSGVILPTLAPIAALSLFLLALSLLGAAVETRSHRALGGRHDSR